MRDLHEKTIIYLLLLSLFLNFRVACAGNDVVGQIYSTDILAYVNRKPIKGYNIGGRTAICLEDMGNLEGSPNVEYGYSKYLGKSEWNEAERTISYESFTRNHNKVKGMLARVSYNFM